MCEIGMRDSLVPEGNEESTLAHNEKITKCISTDKKKVKTQKVFYALTVNYEIIKKKN